ncbi:hypothetical protein CSW59_03515 [Caulobacter sp. BP25]|nr:hypothetical protein CSW59_03515 [Caulobacter sp. BP25]
MVIYVCETAPKAEQARQVLIDQGFPAAAITAEEVGDFTYDAETYANGTSGDASNCWVVTGRK